MFMYMSYLELRSQTNIFIRRNLYDNIIFYDCVSNELFYARPDTIHEYLEGQCIPYSRINVLHYLLVNR